MSTEAESLYHYGVKGMRWGKRKGADDAVLARIAGRRKVGETKEDRQRYKDYKKTTSRKDRKADKQAAIEDWTNKVINDSITNPKNFVQVGTPGYPTMMQGKEFIDYLGKGGAFDPMSTVVTDMKLRD